MARIFLLLKQVLNRRNHNDGKCHNDGVDNNYLRDYALKANIITIAAYNKQLFYSICE